MLVSPVYDIALVADRGQRDTQEDAIAARYFDAVNAGYVVIADGMGGHDAGDVASELVVSAWRDVLDGQLDEDSPAESTLLDALPMAAMQANAAVSGHIKEQGDDLVMGATLLGALMLGNRLFWISIGDSPLFLFRDGHLMQINEDHSLAPMIDAKVEDGLMTEEEARSHPDRNRLTSVIMGAPIPKVDCPERPVELVRGDILIAASDGLQFLDDKSIRNILNSQCDAPSQEIADALLQGLRALGDPDQDNISIAVVKPVNV